MLTDFSLTPLTFGVGGVNGGAIGSSTVPISLRGLAPKALIACEINTFTNKEFVNNDFHMLYICWPD